MKRKAVKQDKAVGDIALMQLRAAQEKERNLAAGREEMARKKAMALATPDIPAAVAHAGAYDDDDDDDDGHDAHASASPHAATTSHDTGSAHSHAASGHDPHHDTAPAQSPRQVATGFWGGLAISAPFIGIGKGIGWLMDKFIQKADEEGKDAPDSVKWAFGEKSDGKKPAAHAPKHHAPKHDGGGHH